MLWPKGASCIEDVPWDLVEAIAQAHTILDWFTNLIEEDRPPQYLWPFTEELNEWFETHRLFKQSQADIASIPADERPPAGYWSGDDDPILRQLKRR
jgi:hypothetical protein